MAKAWEYSRRPQVIVRDMAPITVVRAELRDKDELIAIVVEDEVKQKLTGFLTPREILQVTSHYSSLRAKDLALEEPVIEANSDVADAAKNMESEKIVAVPVVRDRSSMEVVGVLSVFDILQGLLREGYEPIAKTVAEVETREDFDNYLISPDERVNRVWSDLVYRGMLGKIVVRSINEKHPVGLVTLREFLATTRWFFHRESEHGLRSIAKVRSIMLRGVPVATHDTPIEYAARVMSEHGLLLLPVIDPEKGIVVSVLTVYDVIKAYIEGAKPGRIRPALVIPMPIPVKEEERIVYTSSQRVLQQVSVAKPVVETLTGIVVEDIARKELPAITINDTVEHARKLMIRTRSPYIIVVDEKGEIAGVVTKWSMLRAIGLKGPLWRRRINDKYFIEYVMDRRVPRIPAGASLEEAALTLVEEAAEIAIVYDEASGETVGFLTKDDIVEAYKRVAAGRAKVENVMTPGRLGIVHPHHSLAHVIKRMETFYLDAVTVYDGAKVHGVVSANRLPFIAIEDAVEGIKSRRLIWVRKLVKGAARKGRYVKITPLLAIDATARIEEYVGAEEDVVEAIRLMHKHNIDGVPVAGRDGKPAGVICKNDVVRELARTAHERMARGLAVRIERRLKRGAS
ncbi:MAG: CBS domain-containing protein [Pyrodictiaceae archaeon]